MSRQIVKYPDGTVWTRLIDAEGRIVAEYRGKMSLKAALRSYNWGK